MKSNLRPVEPRTCRYEKCGSLFTPKPGGYNALYCREQCKLKFKKKRVPATSAERRRFYMSIKSNPERYAVHLQTGRMQRIAVRKWLADYKLERGCCDCGYKEHFSALQLDHEGKKTAEIADSRSSIHRLLEEIEKGQCVVRCANCHSVKTWRDKQMF